MAEIAKTVSEDYERGFKDGLKSECLKELKPFMVGIAKGCIEAIKGISPMLIDNAQLTIRHAVNLWIPCSERLPDSKEDVLVWFEYFRYGEYNCLYQTYGIGNYNKNYDYWMVNHETGWRQLRVIAWMPMPEPPKGGIEDE